MSNQISEEAPVKEKGAPAAAEGGVEQNSEKTIRQAVYDIRYRARREELDLRHAFSQYMGSSNLNQQEKAAVQEKLFGKEGGSPAAQAEELAFESVSLAMEKVFVIEGNPVQKAWNKFVPPPSQSANPNVRSGKLTPGKLEAGALKTMNQTAANINKPIKATSSAIKTVKGAADTVSKTISKAKDAVQPVTKAVTGAAKKVASAAAKNPKTAAIVAGGALAAGLAGKAIADSTKKKKKDVKESASEQKYKVRVKDKEKPAYVRYADRAKINQLRSNPQISSVEMTGHGDPYEGDKDKKATTSSIQKKPSKGGKKDEVSGKDKRIDLKKEEVTNEGVGMIAAGGAKVALGGAKLAGKAAVGGAKLAGKAAVKTAKVAGKVGKFAAKQTAKTAGNIALNTAKTTGKVAGSVVKRTGRAAVGAVKGALSNEEYLADGNISAPPTNKKITGAKVDNSKLIKVFPQDESDPQIGNIKSSYKPVGQVVSEIVTKEDMNKGYVVTAADKKGNTPAWQGYKAGKKKKDGSPLYTPADHLKNEGVEVKIEGDDDTPATVDALLDVINSKNNDDSRAMYTKWNLAKNKMRAAGLKMSYEPEGEMTEGRVGAAIGGGIGGATGKAVGKAGGLVGGALAGGAVGGPFGAVVGGAAGAGLGAAAGGAVGGGAGAAAGDAAGSAIRGKKAKNIGKTAAAGAVGGALKGGKGAAIGGVLTGADKVKKEGYQRNPEGSVKDRFKSTQTDPSKDGFTGIGDDIGEIMKQNAAMKAAEKKKTKKEGYTNVVEDISDILAQLEKKRIRQGGDPDESPLGKKTGRAMKSQQDKVRKKAGLKTEHHQKDADGNTIPHEDGVICESNLVRSIISKKN